MKLKQSAEADSTADSTNHGRFQPTDRKKKGPFRGLFYIQMISATMIAKMPHFKV